MNRNKITRVLSLIIVFSLIITSTAFANSKKGMNFKWNDFNKNDFKWNKSAYYMMDKGIMKGYGNGDFGFVDYVKRGDVTVMIVRAFQISTILSSIEDKFPDVPVDSYYYDAIATAKYYGIAKGNGKYFNPGNYVTIEEAIALIERSVAVANKHVKVHDVDLNELFSKKDLNSYATRDDIAKMLYYVLTGDIYEEDDNDDKIVLDDIKYEIEKEVDQVTFVKKDFEKTLNNIDKYFIEDDFDYVKFELPLEKYGKLYYNYKSTSNNNSLVIENKKYDIDDFGKITFIQNSDYAGEVAIKYTVYDNNEVSYTGTIKINVEEELTLKTIKYTIDEDEEKIEFDEDDFEDVLDEVVKNFDEDEFIVKFKLPSEKFGKLYYDYKSSYNNSLVIENKEYELDELDEITFVSNSKYTGYVYIKYRAADEDGNSYFGQVRINVK